MEKITELEKLQTYIPGFDHIAMGGLPLGRTTLISGTTQIENGTKFEFRFDA